jgi:hypothetical protein
MEKSFLQRRDALKKIGVTMLATSTVGVAGCASTRVAPSATSPTQIDKASPPKISRPTLAPIRAQSDRITGVYVCTRPFRAAGPRIEMERLGHKQIVHNYGHGGSGWSLSWGSSALAVELARSTNVRELGVIGCGALGLTSAIVAQRAGLSVRIYAKALPPDVYSMRASGLWTPNSRICDAEHAGAFADRWETMARTSFGKYQSLLGVPGNPIQWIDGYALSDVPFAQRHIVVADEPDYGEAQLSPRVDDLTPRSVELSADEHPFAQPYVRRFTTLMFNISSYARLLMNDFLTAGGKIEVREFARPHDLMLLKEHTLINATGYGARALFGDETIIPVRGQTARLIPQPEVTYGLSTADLSIVPRSDGVLVQRWGDSGNFNNADTTPNREASEQAVNELGTIMKNLRA